MSIVRTVTMNSGFDEHFETDGLDFGGVRHVIHYRSQPAGKGVNLARAAAALGIDARCYALVGERDIELFGDELRREGVDHELVPVPGTTRRNLTLRVQGSALPAAHAVAVGFDLTTSTNAIEVLSSRLVADVQPGDIVTLNGSLPVGVALSAWADIARASLDAGARLVIDLQGEALLETLRSTNAEVAKPNEDEATVLLGGETNLGDDASTARALGVLRTLGVRHGMITLGHRGVAHLRRGVPHISSCPVDDVRIHVGAGDVFLAAVCGALADGCPDDAASRGVAAAAAHVEGFAGTGLRRRAIENSSRVVCVPLADATV